MKKYFSLWLLVLFFSVQMYQLCDDANDACEAVSNTIQVISSRHIQITTPTPVDDPDANLPSIVGQALGHAKNLSSHRLVVRRLGSLLSIHPLVTLSPMRVHSPPWSSATGSAPPRNLIALAFSTARTLAPPFVTP